MKEFRKFLLKNRITPKWVIFLLDLLICIASYVYANYLITGFKIFSIQYGSLLNGMMAVGILASASFFIFKTYEGIIRLSEIQEAMRALSAVCSSFLILLLFNIVFPDKLLSLSIPNAVLFCYFLCSSFLICGYRVLVKTLYQNEEEDMNAENIIIYGAKIKGSLLQKTIAAISNRRFRVVAFVDDDMTLTGKTIDSIRIYSGAQLKSLLKPFKVKYLFFSQQDIDINTKNRIADECLVENVQLMNVPPIEEWHDGMLKLNQIKNVKIEDLLGRPAIELPDEHMIDFIFGNNILITGAAGSIGSGLARQIAVMQPKSLILCDQAETALYKLEYELQEKYQLGEKLKIFLGDIKNETSMKQLFGWHHPNVVFHAAAYKHVPVMESHPSEAIRNNVLGTKVLADLSLAYGVERFLFISTDKAINPTNVMGASKRLAEMYCHSLYPSKDAAVYHIDILREPTKFITVRFGNVLASNGSVIPRFSEQIAQGGPVTVTHPEVMRYFMTIPEACMLVLEAAAMGNGGEIFLFDMGKPVNIFDLACKMIKLAGHRPEKDIRIVFTGLRPGEKLYEELLNAKEQVIPTHHKKILIAKVPDHNRSEVSMEIMKLIGLAIAGKDNEVVKQMKYILPEYISNNSVYELYDSNLLTQPLTFASSV